MKAIIYTKADGTLAVCRPAPREQLPDESEDAFIERIRLKDVPASATDARIIDASAIPKDRTFRNAWKVGAGTIEHDMPKCREIHKKRLRELRAPKLAALDVAYMRADEVGDTAKKTQIAAQKQVLRDVTIYPPILAAQTPEDLKAAIPDALK